MSADKSQISRHVTIRPGAVSVNGETISRAGLAGLYRELECAYPKFFKMDGLCRAGFLAAELALKETPEDVREQSAIILFNRSGSLVTDRNYQNTIRRPDNYFPSPALFVYTLANIVTGEIAIRHKVMGETAFYILDHQDDSLIDAIIADTVAQSHPRAVLAGWVEYADENDYLADFKLLTPHPDVSPLKQLSH